jgi:hypothetical protein
MVTSRESIFEVSPKITMAEIATVKGETLFSKTREGDKPVSAGAEVLLRLRSELLAEINSRSRHPDDRIEFVLTSYGNRFSLIIPRGERYLRLVLEKDISLQELIETFQAARDFII